MICYNPDVKLLPKDPSSYALMRTLCDRCLLHGSWAKTGSFRKEEDVLFELCSVPEIKCETYLTLEYINTKIDLACEVDNSLKCVLQIG